MLKGLAEDLAAALGRGVRPPVEADQDMLFRLFALTRGGEFAGLGLAPAMLEHFLRAQFSIQHRQHLGACPPEGRLIIDDAGWLLLREDQGFIHIVDISLPPDRQGLGWGTAILRALFDFAAETGQRGLSLSVFEGNAGAARLYRKLGFVEARSNPPYRRMVWPAVVSGEAGTGARLGDRPRDLTR